MIMAINLALFILSLSSAFCMNLSHEKERIGFGRFALGIGFSYSYQAIMHTCEFGGTVAY